MRVDLVSHTENPERTVATAIKLCYSASDINQLQSELTEADISRLIQKVLKLGHLSVLEHASFTFAIEGISRACSHQLVRHRMASYSQQSQRYVKMQELEYTAPPSVSKEASGEFDRIVQEIKTFYSNLIEEGVPAEDARYILPNAADTKLIMTANAHSLLNFFELRLCNRAQWEIRDLAAEMLKKVKPVAPNIFSSVGPSCKSKGYCREADMSCGRIAAG